MTLSDSDQARINIRPGVGILSLFPHMNYKPWFALAEFVDNAVASFEANRRSLEQSRADYQFRVVIDVDGIDQGFVRVWDNAAGIGIRDYPRAFVTAAPPPDRSGLSEFGIGMKSAACWFARQWRVTSRALGEHVERSVEFDVPKIVDNDIDELMSSSRPATKGVSHTEVRLWDLYKPPQAKTREKMKSHLASIYRQFLDSGELVLEFNGEPLAYRQPSILVAPQWDQSAAHKVTWKKDIVFVLPTGERVTGFAALRETGSTRDAGFALFRRRRLVVGGTDEGYRPPEVFGGSNSFRYQRLFGELTLNDLDITHTKDGFIWGDREQTFLTSLRRELDHRPLPLLQQADKYRSRKADPSVERAAIRALSNTAAAVEHAVDVVAKQAVMAPAQDSPRRVLPEGAVVDERVLDLDIRGTRWRIAIDVSNDASQTDWLTVVDSGTAGRSSKAVRRLGIRVSLASTFMRRFAGPAAEDLEPLLRLAAGVALAEVTAREAGVGQAGTIRRNLNELLAMSLSDF